jgi:hypothetical protein
MKILQSFIAWMKKMHLDFHEQWMGGCKILALTSFGGRI